MASAVIQREGVNFFSDPFVVHDPDTLRAPIRNDLVLTESPVQSAVECTPPSMGLDRYIVIHNPILNAQMSHLRRITAGANIKTCLTCDSHFWAC